MRVGLLALDERPVNTRYPAMIAAIAGVELVQPPLTMLSDQRHPADCEALISWLHEQAADLDVLVVALVMLGYGGLIASRTTHEAAATIINRLETLRQVKAQNPQLKLLGFDLIMRISRADDNFEEPLYWSDYGSQLYEYSQLLDRELQGQAVTNERAASESKIPADYLQDFLARRLRNHIINLTALELAAARVFDLLVISSDDTSQFGLGSREKRWVGEWTQRLQHDFSNVLMYPGADEVGCVLIARMINVHHNLKPRFIIDYAIPGDEAVTAPFEDGPVRLTLERQIRAVGGVIATSEVDADFIIAVNPPSRRMPVGAAVYDADEDAHRTPYFETFVQQIQTWIDAGQRVIVVDVAYPNGSDPVFVKHLFEHVDITRLAAYGAWNTAGNTIGVALAQGVASALPDTNMLEHQRFITHRFLEDWGYQYAVRTEVRNIYMKQHGKSTIAPEHLNEVKKMIEIRLQQRLTAMPGLGTAWTLVPNSIRLPWRRFFEVDFDLKPLDNPPES